jgi:DNA recombination protein RmuC
MQLNVVLLSYSMFVPYLLLTIQTVLKSCQDIDVQKLSTYLTAASESLTSLQKQVEGHLSKAITMLGNSRDEMRVTLARLSSGLAALQLTTQASPPELPGNGDTQPEPTLFPQAA